MVSPFFMGWGLFLFCFFLGEGGGGGGERSILFCFSFFIVGWESVCVVGGGGVLLTII